MASTSDPRARAPERQGTPAAAACYPSLEVARTAIKALEDHGVDGDDLVLAGWRARAAARSHHRDPADAQLVQIVARRSALGIVVGALIGAALGAAIGALILLAWPGTLDDGWIVVVGATGFGAGVVALLGAYTEVERHVGFSEAWPLTLQDVPDGSVWVLLFDDGIHAREALQATGPEEIRRPPAPS